MSHEWVSDYVAIPSVDEISAGSGVPTAGPVTSSVESSHAAGSDPGLPPAMSFRTPEKNASKDRCAKF